MVERRRKRRSIILCAIAVLAALLAVGMYVLYPAARAELTRNRFYAVRRTFEPVSVPDGAGPVAAAVLAAYVAEDPWEYYTYSAPVPEAHSVEGDYFSDAAFLGDSLTDGLMLYSGIKAGNVLAVKGVTVHSIDTKPVIPNPNGGEDQTILEALFNSGEYSKIYILLGINELGELNDSSFINAYRDLVEQLRARYPTAHIYLQSMMPVNERKLKSASAYLNNETIIRRNDLIAKLCEEMGVFYLDLFGMVADETGSLPAEMTNDGVHFYLTHYKTWYEYLKAHTAVPPIGPDEPTGRSALRQGMLWLRATRRGSEA